MPLPIIIDVSGIQKQFNLPKNTVDIILQACVEDVAAQVYFNWINAAKQKLHGTRNGYINGIIKVDKGKFEKAIVLTGKFNNMLENGFSAYDMKVGFANSAKVRFSKAGKWYLTIPFRFGVSGTIGDAEGFTGTLPIDVTKAAQNLPGGTSLKKSDVPSPYDIPTARTKIVVPKSNIVYDSYVHKSSIYEGIRKVVGAYNTTQNKYESFRRVGENSDPNSWINKGITAYRLSDEAVRNTNVRLITENKAKQILDDIL